MTFDDVVAAHLSDWMTVANALTGDEAAAADLVQAALTRTRRSWWRARRRTKPEAVVTSEIVRLFLRAGDRPAGEMPSRARAALVLRAFDNPTDQEIAERLRVSRGAARAAISRGLATLRGSGADETMFARSNWTLTPEPGDVERVVREASGRARRWRVKVALAAAAGVAIVVTAAVAVPSIGSGGSSQDQVAPLPMPRFENITTVDDLAVIFPGVTIREVPRLELGEGRTFEPDEVDESGRLVGTIVGSDPPVAEQIAVFDPASGEVSFIAEPLRRTVSQMYANDNVIVWAETGDLPTRPSPQLTWICVDRTTSNVHEFYLGEGGARPEAIAADGRIAAAPLGRFVYVAQACGGSFEPVADGAAAPRFAGGSLFYLAEDAIWRRDPATAAVPVADRPPDARPFEPRYAVSEGVLLLLLAAGRELDEPWSYFVARLDGSDRQTVQVPHGFLTPYATNAWALVGVVRIPRSGSGEEAFSSWVYAPEQGVIATFEPSADPSTVPYVAAAAGDHLLMAQGIEPGDTRWWLVTFG